VAAELRFATGAGSGARANRPISTRAAWNVGLDVSARRLSAWSEFLDPPIRKDCTRGCTLVRGVPRRLRMGVRHTGRHPRRPPASRSVIGFDVTEFLDQIKTRPPSLFIFSLVRQLLDGRRLVCWLDEFWRLLSDPALRVSRRTAQDWRKLNAVMCLATQSPSDVLQKSHQPTLVEQTAHKVFFPNSDASYAEYTDGFGLHRTRVSLIKEELEPGSRNVSRQASRITAWCQLDLKGFDAELAVISGRATEVVRMND